MKRSIWIIFVILLGCTAIPGIGESKPAFSLSGDAVASGMNRSWNQGYMPAVSGNIMTLIVPVAAPGMQGTLQGELRLKNEAIPLFKPSAGRTARAGKGEGGLYILRFSLELLSDRQAGDYPCRVLLRGDGAEGELSLTLHILDGAPSTEEICLTLEAVEADFTVGEEGTLTARLKNPCAAVEMENIQLVFSDPTGDILPRSSSVLRVGSLAPGEETAVAFPVIVTQKAAIAPHVAQLRFSYTALGKPMEQQESYTLPVQQEMRLEQGGLRMGDTAVAGDSLSLSLPLMNLGRGEIRNVLCTLILPGITERQTVLVGNLAPGESRQAQMTVTVPRDARGAYTGSVLVEGEDAGKNTVSFTLPLQLTAEEPAPALDASESGEEARPKENRLLLYGLGIGCGTLLLALILQGALLRKKIHRLEEDRL